MIYRLLWWLCRLIFTVVCPRRVKGAEHVPRAGPVVLASNHLSMADPPAIGTCVWRRCAFMAKEELFRGRLIAWFLRSLNAYPVRRGAPDRAALRRSLELLEQGWALVIFPEGTRSETGELQEPEMGVGMIVYRSGAAVVPVHVTGTGRVLGRGGRFRPGRIAVAFGPPLRFDPPEGGRAGREEFERAAREIMAAIARLRESGPGRADQDGKR